MTKSRNGGKRPREEAHDKPLESVSFIALSQHPPAFISGLTLSQHPPEQRKDFFLRKVNDVVRAKSLHPTDFEGYTIRERFAKMGWEQLLNFNCDKIYRRVVIQWTASLSRNGDELTGIVDGKSYTITPKNIRDLLEVDTCTDLPYSRFNEAYFQATTDENRERWLEACTTVFGTHENAKKTSEGYDKSKMNPLVKILWEIGVTTFHPRLDEDMNYVQAREICLLHALFTGNYLYSFAHLMIDDIWDMYEHEHRKTIPHGYYISEILSRLGAVSKDEYTEVISPQYRLISRKSFFLDLEFTESPTEYIIDDRETYQRVTFPKKVKQGETPREPLPHIPVVNQHMDMSNLQHLPNKQSPQSEKQLNELVTMITNLQKQMEGQASEAKRHEEERENWLINIQKQIELQAFEAKCREEEREKSLVTNLHKQMELQASESKRREKETETQAEERVKYIVSNIQKQMERQEEERDKRAQEREELMVSRIQKHMDRWVEGRDKRAQDREKSFVTNIQNQMELHASEAKCREQEREKALVTSIQNQMELHASEAKCREEEREKALVTSIQNQMELHASESKRREQETETQAEERVKYIVSNIEQMERQEEERDKQAQEREELMVTRILKHMDRWVEGDKRAQDREKSFVTNIQNQMELHASEAKCREQEREKALVTSIQNQMELHALEAKGHEEERQELLLTNLQKHMEQQAFEAKCRQEEREKLLATNLQKQLELQGLEAKRQEQEREKRSDEKDKYIFNNIQKQMERQEEEREKQAQKREERMVSRIQKHLERQAVEAERREQERERRAEIRAHAIIWDIERQRYFHEQEQEQLRIAWNQFNSANGVDEFQFPHMSHTSFHPPGVDSKYYDPAQGNEIPKEFQSLYGNIYGPRC
ncbi:hypothetical protein Tco_0033179 [Tanacetum coccineum]